MNNTLPNLPQLNTKKLKNPRKKRKRSPHKRNKSKLRKRSSPTKPSNKQSLSLRRTRTRIPPFSKPAKMKLILICKIETKSWRKRSSDLASISNSSSCSLKGEFRFLDSCRNSRVRVLSNMRLCRTLRILRSPLSLMRSPLSLISLIRTLMRIQPTQKKEKCPRKWSLKWRPRCTSNQSFRTSLSKSSYRSSRLSLKHTFNKRLDTWLRLWTRSTEMTNKSLSISLSESQRRMEKKLKRGMKFLFLNPKPNPKLNNPLLNQSKLINKSWANSNSSKWKNQPR